jgi:hypothetical protein
MGAGCGRVSNWAAPDVNWRADFFVKSMAGGDERKVFADWKAG